jgi:hypothetical protein
VCDERALQMAQDFHRAGGHPYSIHWDNCPKPYRQTLVDQCTELVEAGWRKGAPDGD